MTEATQINNEALIAEMLRDAGKATVAGELDKNPVIHQGDAEVPAPMTLKEMTSAGYVWIYDTRTGERMPCIYYMVVQKLRQRRPDGSFRFTTTDPGFRPKFGSILCMLHPDSADRKHFDELGFRVCSKSNLTNKYQLGQHMKKKHPQEWAAIESERIAKEKEEDRALQRLLLASQAGRMEAKPAEEIKTPPAAPALKSEPSEPEIYISDKDKAAKAKKK